MSLSLPIPFIFFYYSFNKYLNTSLCQPQLQLLENSIGEHRVTRQLPTTRDSGGKKKTQTWTPGESAWPTQVHYFQLTAL